MTATITTAEAASRVNVTVATIRTWCRTGVIAAIKQAGRWVIETGSLIRRAQIGDMKRIARIKPVYRKLTHTWRVYAPITTILKALEGDRTVTVHKKDGTTKQQRLNGVWDVAGRIGEVTMVLAALEAPTVDRKPRSAAQTLCAQCGGPGACHRRTDLSDIPGLVCRRCSRDRYLSFA